MFGHPVTVAKGVRNNYAGYDVEIVDVSANDVSIRRVAAYDASTDGSDQTHPLEAWNDGDDNNREKMTGITPQTVVGPVEPKILTPFQVPGGGDSAGGDLAQKEDLTTALPNPPNSTVPHAIPGYFRNADPIKQRVSDTVEIYQSLKAAIKADKDKPIVSWSL
jgi:hypothetical protein